MSTATKPESVMESIAPLPPAHSALAELKAIPLHNNLIANDQHTIRTLSAYRNARTLVGRDVDYGSLAVEMINHSSIERCFAAFEAMTSSKTAADIIYLIHDGAKQSPWIEDQSQIKLTQDQVIRAFHDAQDHRDYLNLAKRLERIIVYSVILLAALILSAFNILSIF